MRLNLATHAEFIPSWNNNLLLDEKEQIKIEYRRIVGEMASFLVKFGLDNSMIFDNARICKECITKIHNLIDVFGHDVKTSDELMKTTGVAGLVTEVGSHILTDSQIKEDLEKKNKDVIALVE